MTVQQQILYAFGHDKTEDTPADKPPEGAVAFGDDTAAAMAYARSMGVNVPIR